MLSDNSAMNHNPKSILLVDDDADFLASAADVLRTASNETWEVVTAASGGEALALLQQRFFNLMALDVNMPVLDGIQMLGLMQRRFPAIVKVVLTGEANQEQRAACLAAGAELVLDKPTTGSGWRDLHTAFDSLLWAHREEGFRGVLRRVSLPDIIQLECLAAKSSVLEVTGAGMRGRIYIKDGQITHAEVGELTGTDALNGVLCLPGGAFHLLPFEEPVQETIAGQWEFLLMEAARVRDESATKAEGGTPASEGAPALTAIDAFTVQSTPAPPDPPVAALKGVAAPAEVSSTPAVPDPDTTTGMQPSVRETLICSLDGEVLYEWNCQNARERVSLLEFITRRAHHMSGALPVGAFDRFECVEKSARCVAKLDDDRALFVRIQSVMQSGIGNTGLS
jgi:CheY-like chemotaxis protein